MQNDKYRTPILLFSFVLFLLVMILKQYWLLWFLSPFLIIIVSYVYYKKLLLIPKEDRLKAVLPTIIATGIIVLMMLVFLNVH